MRLSAAIPMQDVDTVFAPELAGTGPRRNPPLVQRLQLAGRERLQPVRHAACCFSERKFKAYWFETGTPSFLVKLLASRGYYTSDLAKTRSNLTLLSTFDVDNIASEALLFQTGYLTIRAVQEPLPGQWIYTLGYPNKEVESSLNASLLGAYGSEEHQALEQRLRLLELLQANDFGGLRELFHAFYASIPHDWYRKNELARYEGYYASIFYSHFAALGLDIVVEDSSNKGRVDHDGEIQRPRLPVRIQGGRTAARRQGHRAAQDQGLRRQIPRLGEPVHLSGVELSRESRNIVGFEAQIPDQLTASPKSVWMAIKEWREQVDFSGVELTDREVDSWRERSPGRDFAWKG